MIIQRLRVALAKLRSIIKGWFRYLFFKPSEIGKYRIKICKSCFYRSGFLCGECGCVLAAKVESDEESCPLNKW